MTAVAMRVISNILGLLAAMSTLSLPVEGLYRDVAVIAYHFHWSREECMSMSRRERHAWLEEISRINKEISKAAKPKGRKS